MSEPFGYKEKVTDEQLNQPYRSWSTEFGR